MAQNKTHAVMAQRAEPDDSLDDFPTPSWATRALMETVLVPMFGRQELRGMTCWEPACNRGFMTRPLGEYFGLVRGTDVHAYLEGQVGVDFLWPGTKVSEPFDFLITNPPFRLAEQFIDRAMGFSRLGCAVLVRTTFLESVGRFERLFRDNPPTVVAFFSERVPMVRGRVDETASTATSYSWLVWVRGFAPRPPMWIPPCRAQLERPGDYSL